MAQSPPTSFTINVFNTAPYFIGGNTLHDQSIRFNQTFQYYLPPIRDDEGHAFSILIESFPPEALSFTTNVNNEYLEFNPT
jgi:hypothetical protein